MIHSIVLFGGELLRYQDDAITNSTIFDTMQYTVPTLVIVSLILLRTLMWA